MESEKNSNYVMLGDNFNLEKTIEEIDSLNNPTKELFLYTQLLASDNISYDSTTIRTLGAMAHLASVRAGAEKKKLEKLSMKDPLTGLGNRRDLEAAFKRELALVKRNPDYNFSVAMVDVDHFKKFNDDYGHNAGDNVLRNLSEILRITRESDIPFRYGGEEFCVLFPNTDKVGALRAAYNLNRRVANSRMIFKDKEKNGIINISIGVDEVSRRDSDLYDVIDRVDRFLYEAKNAGRNCVVGRDGVYNSMNQLS